MSQPTYTSIPDTTDSTYWIITQNGQDRSTTFVPRDKELHRQLKQNAKKPSQSISPYKERKKKN